ncbi:MAG: TIGR04283 family arsenosugar biosynthesis glycosyltransferase [Methylobacter sp.]|nr:TIGR04283 family arsenosugar biosynthesis glycosyltransferase [Methylobacter sp.]MDP2099883.1 TIGR04283 family arsenosugar biosynthesis glycosyltransferase [Methylobacter sp.]MDP2427442.1 TIGR04283 family arsenosugar biosynthesis glycosyltransferase [Methylobacter sp.]MDP3054553.1 TIGR04283 family arsenosugar biosynthesis glycosyltransferase [Methylobacter sp.]MDP3362158.1 TIGR04283 family arsenosugar biosynthesis glycosyltransferase [Methylobacter sp.]
MKFSIIIPALNEQQGIKNCLLALQHYRGQAEIILVDGGSSDKTVHIATALVDNLLSSDKGRAKQMNVGAKAAQGDILIFLHSDTYLPDNALALISENIGQAAWGRFDIRLTGTHWMLAVIARMMNWRSRLTGIATGDQAIFAAKTAFEAINGYADIALMEDIDLCRRLKKISPPLCLNAKVHSSARRWQAFGVFKIIVLMWSCRLGYFLGEKPGILAQHYQQGRYWLPFKH